jgi:predicted O-methyltransferase YrrM
MILHPVYQELFDTGDYKIASMWPGTSSVSLCMKEHGQPISITSNEFEFIRTFIAKHKLKYGFEVATAFGVSALALALGVKEGAGEGKVVTMDAYIEEHYGACDAYMDKKNEVYKDSSGWKSVNKIIEKYELQDILYPEVGWSPDDTEDRIRDVFGEPLQFAFIDALHTDEAMIEDLRAVLPLLDHKFVIFFHDTHCFKEKARNFVLEKLGRLWDIPLNCVYPRGGYNLGMVTNLE